jgi:hypothetical protein
MSVVLSVDVTKNDDDGEICIVCKDPADQPGKFCLILVVFCFFLFVVFLYVLLCKRRWLRGVQRSSRQTRSVR